MALHAGTRLGPYEILSPIGAGAMGHVYKARDTRLGRDVAIKVLPPGFARDPDRLARFEREARAVAAINHPNIVAVHDIGSADVVDAEQGAVRAAYLITELLDGDTLRARLAHGPLPARKSVDVAMQIARGLSAAHDRGIVHRDLKPENIVLLRDGHVKILDFGLAKQSTPPAGSGEQQTIAATDAGTVLGTVGYMAPEQVRGETADPRSDLFALGAVLFELATGRRAFERPTAAETMTAILREELPDLTGLAAGLPPGLDRIVRHALEKDPANRFQSARDFAFALQALNDATGSGIEPVAAARPVSRSSRRRELAAWSLAGALAVAVVAVRWWSGAALPSASSPIIFAPVLPWRDGALTSPSISHDGARVAFIAHGRSGDAIVVRRLDALAAQPLKGTSGARPGGVFWSPDGQSLGFFAGGKLKTIELATGKIEEIADAPSGYGGTWGPDGTILFSPNERTPIFRVSAKGGDATAVTTLDAARKDEAHRWPHFLPDGRHFVFMPWSSGTVLRKIQLASLDGTPPKTLFESESAPVVAGIWLIYVRDLPSRLLAQAFNPRTFELDGRPIPLVTDDDVDYFWPSGDPLVSASAGMLIYTTGKFRVSQLTWFNRAGRPLGTVGDPDVYYDPVISVDGTTLAVEKRETDHGATDLWTVDLTRGAFSRLTSATGYEDTATWSPDKRRIAFASDQGNAPKIWVKNASGTGAEDALVEGRAFPTDWSRDARYLLYMTDGGATRMDVWAYDFERRTSTPLLASPFNERSARFSPDGKWIAYVSDEAHDAQVYVRSFPDGATKIQISTAGGDQPEWRRDGRELFYLAPDSTLMAVDVHASGAGFAVGAAQPLFLTNVEPDRVLRNNYASSIDGQKFLVMSPLVSPSASPLVGVINWAAVLSRKP
jgi:Tol biopolymer transport system component/tRNA A-37 threonylcarbamoyl transferase component Bud32